MLYTSVVQLCEVKMLGPDTTISHRTGRFIHALLSPSLSPVFFVPCKQQWWVVIIMLRRKRRGGRRCRRRAEIYRKGGKGSLQSTHLIARLPFFYIYISCVRTETSHLKMGEKLDHLGQEPSIQLVAAIEQRCCCFPLRPMHLSASFTTETSSQ
jgi:hypothetical protein